MSPKQLSQNPLEAFSIENVIQLAATPPVILILIGISVILFGFMSIILLHHWKSYSVNEKRVKYAMRTFFIGGGIIVVIIFITGVLSLK